MNEEAKKSCKCCGREAKKGKTYQDHIGLFTFYCGLRCLQVDQLGGRLTK